jgi:hypothetical protein
VHYKQKLESMGMMKTVDKSVGLAVASLTLIGAVVGLIFPPAGFAILVAASAIGVAYLVGRVTFPLFKSLGEKISNYFTKKSESNLDQQADEGLKNDLTESLDKEMHIELQFNDPKVIKEARRLEKTVAGDPLIHHSPSTKEEVSYATVVATADTTVGNEEEDKEQEGEGESTHPPIH